MRQFELNLEGAEKQTVFADAIRVVDGSLELQRHNGDIAGASSLLMPSR